MFVFVDCACVCHCDFVCSCFLMGWVFYEVKKSQKGRIGQTPATHPPIHCFMFFWETLRNMKATQKKHTRKNIKMKSELGLDPFPSFSRIKKKMTLTKPLSMWPPSSLGQSHAKASAIAAAWPYRVVQSVILSMWSSWGCV